MVSASNSSTFASASKDNGSVMQIVNALKKMLIEENLKVGDKIPSEPVLCEKLGKSRGSIREAIKILESFGVLHVRKGDGTYITASANTGIFDALFFRIIAMGTNFHELVQLRIILETAIVDMIIRDGGESSLSEIKKKNSMLEEAIDTGTSLDTLIQLDVDFHIALSEACGNGLLKNIYLNMMDVFIPYIRNSYTSQHMTKEFYSTGHHKAIIQAIIEKDFDLAHYAVRKSMQAWRDQNTDSTSGKY